MQHNDSTDTACLEYIWIDARNELRSKIKIMQPFERDIFKNGTFRCDGRDVNVPAWNFDGSSTGQSSSSLSDVVLNPVRIYKNPFFSDIPNAYMVLCECYNGITNTPSDGNTRAKCADTCEKYEGQGCIFGIEQEYVLFSTDHSQKGTPYGWLSRDDPGCGQQGPYYCSVGGDRSFGRAVSERHLSLCLRAGVQICGTNAEVMASQWEFQIGANAPLRVCDDLVIARYILHRVTEEYGCSASLHPKPYKGDWNGSGAHTNFSTRAMRGDGGITYIVDACEKMRSTHAEHISVYGLHNELRLTGRHETSSLTKYSWGEGNRGCSVRIPLHVVQNKRGYLEDRRPASNCDPYMVTRMIMESCCF
jgi:glutamine synthetase